MNKIIVLFFAIFLLGSGSLPALSNDAEEDYQNFHYTCFVKKHLSEEAQQLNVFLAKYFQAQEDKDIKALKELYSDRYLSGDRLGRDEVMKLVQESWNLTDDLQYSNEIQNIRFDSGFAAVEINENLVGTTKTKSDITNDNGLVESSTRTVFYLQKYGKGWKIVSDKTIYEETSIKYGNAKDLSIDINAPEQVFSNVSYGIALQTEIPPDTFALGSINNEPLIYPRKKTEEIFKQVPSDVNLLERVVKANSEALNELAVASVSYCKVKKGSFTLPEIEVEGTAVLLKRVNVE